MGQGGFGFTLLYFAFLIGIMYLIIFLPQKKREKRTREMLGALEVGNDVVTIGGIIGKIVNIKDDEVAIETSVEKTQMNIKKWAVKEVKRPVEG